MLNRSHTTKIACLTLILVIVSMLSSACSTIEFSDELTPTPRISPLASSTPEPTPSQTAEPSPTKTPTPYFDGLGVSLEEVQIAFDDLMLVFDPTEEENGRRITVGGIGLNDASYVVVILVGPDENLTEASVTIMEPIIRLSIETEADAAKTRGKWLFVMQAMVDAVFPDWEESSTWLDETLRSFSDSDGTYTSGSTSYRNTIITMETEVMSGEMDGFLSVALIITTH